MRPRRRASGAVLDDQDAYDLLGRWCGMRFARAFKLYKLYERAAALTGAPVGPARRPGSRLNGEAPGPPGAS